MTDYWNILGCLGIMVLLINVFFYLDRIVSFFLYSLIAVGILYGFYRYYTSKGQPLAQALPTRNEWLSILAILVLVVVYFFLGIVNRFVQSAIFVIIIYLSVKLYMDLTLGSVKTDSGNIHPALLQDTPARSQLGWMPQMPAVNYQMPSIPRLTYFDKPDPNERFSPEYKNAKMMGRSEGTEYDGMAAMGYFM